jgi:hypothetical protein
MKIIVLDDDGNTIFEEDNPGHIHEPLIFNGIHDISCDDDDCPDPRCIERRDDSEKLIAKWHREQSELAFVYHFSDDPKDLAEYKRRPNFEHPLKVKIHGLTRNEVVLENGDELPFLLPHVNVYSDDQVTFSTGKWNASLSPWRAEYHDKKSHTKKGNRKQS